jgi:hypothetical protein
MNFAKNEVVELKKDHSKRQRFKEAKPARGKITS